MQNALKTLQQNRLIRTFIAFVIVVIVAFLCLQRSFFIVWPIVAAVLGIAVALAYFRNFLWGLVFGIFIFLMIGLGKTKPVTTYSVLENEQVELVRIDIKAQNIPLTVRGESTKLLELTVFDATSKYAIEPSYNEVRTEKLITIRPLFTQTIPNGDENISLKVGNLPTRWETTILYSRADLDLSKTKFAGLHVKAASGDIILKLPNECVDCSIIFQAWSTKMIVFLPKDVGLKIASMHPSIGVKFPGKDFNNAGSLQTDNYDSANVKYNLEIKGSSGSIVINEYTVE